jgi:cytochrome c biogenesis protein CcmG, thiol:disulfide interchange protein DsbE
MVMSSSGNGQRASGLRGGRAFVLRWCLVVTVVAVSVGAAPAAEAPCLKIGMPLPSVTLSSLRGGAAVVPDSLRGKVVILHFWAGWCDRCKEEMPVIEALLGSYSRKGLGVAAVNVGQKRGAVQTFVSDLKLTMPVYLDEAKKVADRYEVVGVPRTFILDRKGVIRYKIAGPASEEVLKKFVQSLL